MTLDRFRLILINKVKTVIDRSIWPIYLLFKNLGVVKPVEYSVMKVMAPVKNIVNPLPVNYSPEDELRIKHSRIYHTNELKIFSIKNVNVSSKGVVFKKLSICETILIHPVFRFSFGLRYLVGLYLSSKREDISDDSPVILLFDQWSICNYYHWVIDSLSRLETIKEELANSRLVLPYDVPAYVRQSLQAFNFKEIIEIKKNRYVHIKNLLVPNYTSGSGWHNKEVLGKLKTDIIGSNLGINKGFEKIYVSRAKQKNRRVSNEEEVIDLVKEYGFSVVYFEGMSFWEQVGMMQNAKYFISSHGANITNIFFMPEEARVLELNKEDNPNFCYYSLATNTNLSYYYQLCKLTGHDDIVVDIVLLRKNIELLLSN